MSERKAMPGYSAFMTTSAAASTSLMVIRPKFRPSCISTAHSAGALPAPPAATDASQAYTHVQTAVTKAGSIAHPNASLEANVATLPKLSKEN
jgi:hypothetical protein